MQFKYSFPALEAYPQHEGEANVVFTIHWRLDGTDGDKSAGVYGSVGVTYAADEPFTPFAELTEAKVLEWVKEAMGDATVLAHESAVVQQIQDKKNPPVISPPLPWA